MVPLAVGSQTNGSVIRPAAYCGVYGFKPTSGLISRHGVLRLSRQLDQIGAFARTIEDVALIAEALMRFDPRDGDMRPQAPPALRAVAATEPPVQPRLAFIRTPVWDEATTTTKEAFAELLDELGSKVEEMHLPPTFDEAIATHRAIFEADIARNLATDYERAAEHLSPVLRDIVERGRRVPAVDYIRAVERIETLNRLLQPVFEWSDAIITPAVTGEAPIGLDSTGSPIFCTLWTLCGVPAVTVPILRGESGMPIGVQLVGPRGDDARLLRTARWLVDLLRE
jgi:Asp-tRNA(Asn)/Glu-tRNA(Gln) amidotransferase A subunit family amidase